MKRETQAQYRARSQRHRPDAAQLAAECRRLASTGLTARDIAESLILPLFAVDAALADQNLTTTQPEKLK